MKRMMIMAMMPTVIVLAILAPKGRQDVAWGVSPRDEPAPKSSSPEGAAEVEYLSGFCRPSGAGVFLSSTFLGLTPQATFYRPSGARKTDESLSQPWHELFNGHNLSGWHHLGGGKAHVENGLLLLEHDPERRPGYLVSAFPAVKDFEAIVVCQVPTGDSGFFYRGKRHPLHATEFMGPQVQLNTQPNCGLGGIFELHGRCWVKKPNAALNAQLLEGLDWINCAITVRGSQVQVKINGVTTVDVTDAGADNHFQEAGNFALQIHGGGYCRAVFRRLAVRRLDGKGLAP